METLEGTNPMNLLILALAIIGGGYLLFKVAGKIIKTVGIIILLGLVYYFWQGGTSADLKMSGTKTLFTNAKLSTLESRYCKEGKEEKTKCLCITTPVAEDLQSRLSAKEMQEIDLDQKKVYTELHKSMRNKRKQINNCLIKNKGAKGVGKLVDMVKSINVSFDK